MTKSKIIIVVSLFVVAFLVFLVIDSEEKTSEYTHTQEREEKKSVAANVSEVKMLSGTVRSISGELLNVRIFPMDGAPEVDVRTIDISGVPIRKRVPLLPEEMHDWIEDDLSENLDLLPPNEDDPMEDGMSRLEPASTSEIKPGDVVTVVSDTDIRSVKEIKPKDISFVFGSQVSHPEGYQP